MVLGLLRAEAALPDELLDQGVVVGHLGDGAVAHEVGPGVADVAEQGGVVVFEGDGGERRAHPLQGLVVGRLGEDGGVGRLDRIVESLPADVGGLERLDGGGAGHLPGPVAAHPVGHGVEAVGGVDEAAVLVLRPPPADVGPRAVGEPHCTISSTVWPIWSLSPRWSGIVLLNRSRLRNVPLVEPRSSTKGLPSRM